MKHARKLLAVTLAACSLSVPSQAATITRTFAFNPVFTDGGPVTTAGFTFGVTYNDGSAFDKAVDFFNTTTSDPAFNVKPVIFSFDGVQFVVNGRENGLLNTLPDFAFVFYTDLSTRGVVYNEAGGSNHFSSGGTYTETTGITAVPEPATWALMLAGFGGIGFAMRRRQRRTVAYA